MKSMTSFGYAEYSCDNYMLSMEIKSVNSRFLEINCLMPPVFSAYESEITELIKKNAQRGHVDLYLKLKVLKGAVDVNLDEKTASSYMEAFSRLRKMSGMEFDLKLDLAAFAQLEGVMASTPVSSFEAYREGLDYCSSEIMKQFAATREREGKAMKKNLSSLIDQIDSSLSVIKANAADMERSLRESLESRIRDMLGDKDYDENRLLMEVALLLNKYTISEEMVRLDAHIAEFRRLLESEEPVGKRMDFLSQEMNREINTIGSKNQVVSVSFEVVNMKDSLENIREQIRNIE